ncbi:MAG: type II secretion system F family protein [Rhodospirillales bacterium]|nr:type II secretion system F family protein [Alphaproteobacteria bacterium]USO04517.1 MAG: type II secretion system F family protein [Rhodospirillales bacterium]
MFGITSDLIIVVVSALAAALSFAAFALPFLQRGEQKARYKDVIEKRRKTLFDTTRQELENKGQKSVSAKDSVATFFKVQKLAGELGEKIRTQLLVAGIRNPMAPIFYILAQIILPIIFVAFSMLFISAAEKEVSNSMTMIILVGAIFTGFFLPRLLVKNQGIKRQEELNISFPDSLDMMLICVQGGIGLEQTVERVAEEVSEHAPVLAEELGILSAEMAMLSDRRAALSDFGRRVGGYGKSFATALIQAEQYGTSVSQALRVMADELRDIRMAKAEQKAASLPPKLTVPMILFFLPALFIVILGPAGISASAAGIGGG